MISNINSTFLVYSTEYIRVKVRKGREPRQRFQSACEMHRPMRFWRVRLRALPAPAVSALRRKQGLPSLMVGSVISHQRREETKHMRSSGIVLLIVLVVALICWSALAL
jgi:hypothetical protein